MHTTEHPRTASPESQRPGDRVTERPAVGIVAYGCGPAEGALFRALAPTVGAEVVVVDVPPTTETAALAAGHRCVSVGHTTPVDLPVLRALRDVGVRHVSTRSIGLDHVDVESARGLGISVSNIAYSPDGVADYTLMLVLMAVRKVRSILRRVDEGDYRPPDPPSRDLRDLTVGVVGVGRIGGAVIERLRPFGCRILVHDRRVDRGADATVVPAWASALPLDSLLRKSDVVTLHLPHAPETHHLLDRRRVELMKPGAVLVNTARGGLVDTDALVDALDGGHLAGVALDVLDGEERVFGGDRAHLPAVHPMVERLVGRDDVLLSPHVAYYTDRVLAEAVEASLAGCVRVARELGDA